ncbi:CDGSH iron-sulfur domain-containing NEET [Chlorella sorokiniana]|uniref:CDGSH iron-sulfur domain-containing NEET n=1 Tax=Chlorella sorokiniana TaxID=3076 RepID=A0A2P6TX16_CHLSO|nr:CDGSH iron-sulfur domain-containing NEET [Chlorella sorokiniana]|eukprot:PRW58606.1 CDGSH iron-sulfur domain-containing NEET [Chlorella sorokiniana]
MLATTARSVALAPRTAAVRVSRRAVAVRASSEPINPSIKKDVDKVVDTVSIKDLDKPKVAYCRCWRSDTFPLCNGAHVKHNAATGDNVGPLLVAKE